MKLDGVAFRLRWRMWLGVRLGGWLTWDRPAPAG